MSERQGAHLVSRLGEPELFDRVAAKLREIERRSGIDRTLAIGELVLNQFFGGDVVAWRDRRRNKNNSIRRLANREGCPFSKSALNESVAVYVASLTLPCVRTFGHIGASHVASVLKLPQDEREAMLMSADRERVSVRELRKRVALLRRAGGEARGRPPDGLEERSMSLVRNGLARVEEGLRKLLANAVLADETRAELRDVATTLAAVLAEVRSRFVRRNESGVVPAVETRETATSGASSKRSA